MATIVKTDKEFARYRMFNTQDKHDIFVTDFDDGVAKIDFTDDHTPESMARISPPMFSISLAKEIVMFLKLFRKPIDCLNL